MRLTLPNPKPISNPTSHKTRVKFLSFFRLDKSHIPHPQMNDNYKVKNKIIIFKPFVDASKGMQ